MGHSNQFRSYVWDPVMILSQMLTMQCIYYFSMGMWVSASNFVVAAPRSLDQIFRSQTLAFSSTSGRLHVAALALNALTSALGLWFVVRRTKQCLDFAATSFLIHLLLCSVYAGAFPSSLSWWLTQIFCVALMTVLGEYLCMRTELQAIPVSIGSLNAGSQGSRSDL